MASEKGWTVVFRGGLYYWTAFAHSQSHSGFAWTPMEANDAAYAAYKRLNLEQQE